MSWQNRVLPNINLTSPDGTEFEGLFQDSTTTNSKKLGIFSYPGLDGEVVQDLGLNSDKYSFAVIFAGDDHDLLKKQFEDAIKERGTWNVIHPVRGLLILQIVDYSVSDSPTSAGGYTQFDINWIEPLPDSEVVSTASQGNLIEQASEAVNNSSAVAFANNVTQTIESATQALRDVTEDITNLRDAFLDPIAKLNNAIYNLGLQIQRSINDTISETIIDVESLSGQYQQLFLTPATVETDINTKISAYENVINAGNNLTPETATVENKNIAASQECFLLAALCALCISVLNSTIKTRSEAIQTADTITDLFSQVTEELDKSQTLYKDEAIDSQYFSQSESYSDVSQLVSLTLKYLTSLLFNLQIEKKFILDKNKTPIQVVIEEYGELGENDINLDSFIDINHLKNNEIILMRAGSEVVVYV